MIYMIMFMIKFIVLMVLLLISVAFFTLYERKILGYIQIRKGPNKVGYLGIFQPFADGAKLFMKEDMMPLYLNNFIYYLSPIYGMILGLTMLSLYPGVELMVVYGWGGLFFLCISSLSVYSIIMMGWVSSSKYSNLGGYRAVAQTISYEVSMSFLLLALIMFFHSFCFYNMYTENKEFYIIYLSFFMIWMGIILAETNRSPFDLAESESELVSGFNTEYSGGGFALIFITEYMNIIMMSVISVMVFMNSVIFLGVVIMMYYLWVRGSFPRMRYDYLMYMSWKLFLPLVIGGLMFFSMISMYL